MGDLATANPNLLVEMRGITKRFGNVTVLDNVDFDLRAGEVHVLAGENGAGKSTLIKILAGAHADFDGEIRIQGQSVRPKSPLHANELGVAVIYQELSLIGPMSVADNIFLGRSNTRAGFMDDRSHQAATRELLRRISIEINPSEPIERYSIATQQCIEIAKALSRNAKAIVMDEPTSALPRVDVERLFVLIEQLKGEGCGIVYITHKMDEIERIADRITVLRDGKRIGAAPKAHLPIPALIKWMVGRDLGEQFPARQSRPGKARLEVRDFDVYPRGQRSAAAVRGASLAVRAGEVVGIGGLQGSGASELLLGIFGAFGNNTTGQVFVDGEATRVTSPRSAIDSGIALLTNDRKGTGLVLGLSIVANMVLASLKRLSRMGWRQPAAEREAANRLGQLLRLRAASLDMPVGSLSGGNQQKVAIGKWLQTKPRVLLLDEPTRGIDVGAKREIYALINDLLETGLAILLITTEMPELLALSDRVIVMHRGAVKAEYARNEATPERVLATAMGRSSAIEVRT
jgi:ABC-type sugar transport system ATPase subunit